jgi:hypothetical protein
VLTGESLEDDHRTRSRARDRVGVVLLWLLIIASIGAIVLIGRAMLAMGHCGCEGDVVAPIPLASTRG